MIDLLQINLYQKNTKNLKTLFFNFDLKLQVNDDNDYEMEVELDEPEMVRQETPSQRFVNFVHLYSMAMTT